MNDFFRQTSIVALYMIYTNAYFFNKKQPCIHIITNTLGDNQSKRKKILNSTTVKKVKKKNTWQFTDNETVESYVCLGPEKSYDIKK